MIAQAARPVFQVSVVAIMIFQVAALCARSMLQLSLMDNGHSRALAADLSYLVVPPILLVLMFPYLRRCKDALLGLLRRADLTLRLVVLSVLLGVILRATYWATLMVLMWLGVVANDDPDALAGPVIGFQCPPLPVLMLSLVVMAFLVPVIEEVIHRGFIVSALLARGVLVSLPVSALLFAVLHREAAFVVSFIGGMLFALQMLNYRTLWATIITHATYNAAAVFDWECLVIVWNPSSSDPHLSTLGAASMPVAAVGILLAAALVSKKAAGACRMPRRTADITRPARPAQ